MEQYTSRHNHDAEDLLDLFDKDDIGLRYIRHHLLENFDDVNTYDGPVRQITLKSLSPFFAGQRKFVPTGGWLRTSSGSLFADQSRINTNNNSTGVNKNLLFSFKTKTTSHTALQDDGNNKSSNQNSNGTSSGVDENGNYSTALSVTIAVGCSLLILNMLIFAGVYYQLDRHAKSRANSPVNSQSDTALYRHSQKNLAEVRNPSTLFKIN